MSKNLEVSWDDGGEQKAVRTESPSLATDRIGMLDGVARTVVVIESDGIQVGIGGGNEGRVIAYFTRDSQSFFNLVGDPRAKGSSELVAGGQPGDFDRRHIVDAPTAISAVRELIDDGAPTNHLWEAQD